MSFENLRVYQAARELRREIEKLRPLVDPSNEGLFEHVVDAADSIMNNIAEGSSSIYPGKRRSYFDISAGSCREVRSGLRSLDERNAFGGAKIFRHIVLTLAIDKMLRKMIDKLSD